MLNDSVDDVSKIVSKNMSTPSQPQSSIQHFFENFFEVIWPIEKFTTNTQVYMFSKNQGGELLKYCRMNFAKNSHFCSPVDEKKDKNLSRTLECE